MAPDKVKFGLFNDALASGDKKVQPLIDLALNDGFNFAVAPILGEYDANQGVGQELDLNFVHDFEVAPKNWKANFQALLKCTIDTGPRSDLMLERQIGYASHLGVRFLWIDVSEYESFQLVKLCRVIKSVLTKLPNTTYTVPEFRLKVLLRDSIPVSEQNGFEVNGMDCGEKNPESTLSAWKKCALVRDTIHADTRVGFALELEENLPDEDELNIWDGERILALIIPTQVFLTNSKGYPVLPVSHQDFVKRVIYRQAFKVDIVVQQARSGEDGQINVSSSRPLHLYFQYMDWLRNQSSLDTVKLVRGYEDYLQIPLQPLKDHLESDTYAVFEDDAIKYIQYEAAIKDALFDKKEERESKGDTNKTMVVMVLGAGRGPLVTASILAAKAAAVDIKIIVVERNPHAMSTLRHLKVSNPTWQPIDITIHHCDMRNLVTSEKADICVSELLGSLGDNELSPECLSHIWNYLKPDGVCIPQSYTSHVQPIMSPRLFNNTMITGSINTNHNSQYNPMDIAYVVLIRNYYPIDKPQELITFTHFNPETDKSVETDVEKSHRYVPLSFTVSRDCTVHGFAGYFDTVLYKNVTLSTHPDRQTDKMYSWFPFWIPLREAVSVKKGEQIKLHFWRIASPRDVWYEWCLSEPRSTPIQNSNGESNRISLV